MAPSWRSPFSTLAVSIGASIGVLLLWFHFLLRQGPEGPSEIRVDLSAVGPTRHLKVTAAYRDGDGSRRIVFSGRTNLPDDSEIDVSLSHGEEVVWTTDASVLGEAFEVVADLGEQVLHPGTYLVEAEFQLEEQLESVMKELHFQPPHLRAWDWLTVLGAGDAPLAENDARDALRGCWYLLWKVYRNEVRGHPSVDREVVRGTAERVQAYLDGLRKRVFASPSAAALDESIALCRDFEWFARSLGSMGEAERARAEKRFEDRLNKIGAIGNLAEGATHRADVPVFRPAGRSDGR